MQQRLDRGERDISTLLFDMDNTLFDLVEAKRIACREVVARIGKGDPGELFRYFLSGQWGFEDWRNIRDYLNDISSYSPEQYDRCCEVYDTVKLERILPYPHVSETLAALRERGFRLAVVTDAFNRDAVRRLQKTDLRSVFDLVVTCDLTGKKKPAPEPFLYALRTMQVYPDEVVLVGDSPHRDMEPGRGLGMKTVYARYGDRFSDTRTSLHADYVIDCISELLDIMPLHGCSVSSL
jgi:putative hydrolase of the HAD superfamily